MRINIALFLVAVMICGAVSAPVDQGLGNHLIRRSGSGEESDTSSGKEEKSSSKSDDAETEEDTSSKSEKTEKSSKDTSESNEKESINTTSESKSKEDSENTEEETKSKTTTDKSKSEDDSESGDKKTDKKTTEKEAEGGESESASTGKGGISGSFEGMSTFYDGKGTHACGNEGKDGELTVAINTKQMGTKSNGNVNCFKTMTIVWKGKTAKAKVTDQCPPCADKQIDVSQAVADFFGDDFISAGENQVTWSM